MICAGTHDSAPHRNETPMTSRTTRRATRPLPRTLAVTSVLALTAGLSACSTGAQSGSGDPADQTLKVAVYAGSWGESFTKAFVEPFEEETGATVELVPGGPADWLTALRSTQGGTPAYDVVAFTPNVIPSAVSAGVVAELDTDRIAQFDQLNTVLAEQSNVSGTQYGLPLTVGSTGIAYRTDQVEEPPTDWSDLLDPQYCSHVAVSPLTFNTGVEFLAGLINEAGGTITDPADVDAAFKQLETLKDCASTFPRGRHERRDRARERRRLDRRALGRPRLRPAEPGRADRLRLPRVGLRRRADVALRRRGHRAGGARLHVPRLRRLQRLPARLL